MADIPARTEIGVTTGPIRGSKKIHVGPLNVAMREIYLEPSSGEPPVRVYAVAKAAMIATSTALASMLRVMRTKPAPAFTRAPREQP